MDTDNALTRLKRGHVELDTKRQEAKAAKAAKILFDENVETRKAELENEEYLKQINNVAKAQLSGR